MVLRPFTTIFITTWRVLPRTRRSVVIRYARVSQSAKRLSSWSEQKTNRASSRSNGTAIQSGFLLRILLSAYVQFRILDRQTRHEPFQDQFLISTLQVRLAPRFRPTVGQQQNHQP